MKNSFNSIIESTNSFLVLLPTKPYFDQVAAGLSLYLSLRDKKTSEIYCPSSMTVEFNRLVGVNKIATEIGNKDLSLRFVDYPAKNIERVSYDIENGEFRLAIIPKPGVISPRKEQIEFTYSGISANTVVLIGGANETHFPALSLKELVGAKIVHIGPRQLSTTTDMGILSFAKPASSCSEIVAGLIKETNLTTDADIATNLLMGIEEGSSNFTSDTTAETFEIFAHLMREGGKRIPKDALHKESFPQGSIPGKLEIEKKKEDTPREWMQPKIYKGNSIS